MSSARANSKVSLFSTASLSVLGNLASNYFFKNNRNKKNNSANEEKASSSNLQNNLREQKTSSPQIENSNQLPRITAKHWLAQTFYPSEIVKEDLLGKGTYGRVYSCAYGTNRVAVKFFNDVFELCYEANVITRLNSNYIISSLGCSFNPPCLMLEYADYGSFQNLKNQKNISMKDRIQIALDICHAIEDMHSQGYLHIDIRGDNVLIFRDENRRLRSKLADFSLGVPMDSKDILSSNILCTAPELYNQKSITIPAALDIYSFGLFLSELFFPCDHIKYFNLSPSFRKSNNYILLKMHELFTKSETDCPDVLQRLIMGCIQTDSSKRPTIESIKKILTDTIKKYPPQSVNDCLSPKLELKMDLQETSYHWIEKAFEKLKMMDYVEEFTPDEMAALYAVINNETKKNQLINFVPVITKAINKTFQDENKSENKNENQDVPSTELIRKACEQFANKKIIPATLFYREYRNRKIKEATLLEDKPLQIVDEYISGVIPACWV